MWAWLPERPRCTAPAGCRSWTPQGRETSSPCCSGGGKKNFYPLRFVKYGRKPSTPRFLDAFSVFFFTFSAPTGSGTLPSLQSVSGGTNKTTPGL